jgi:hypothetical protein
VRRAASAGGNARRKETRRTLTRMSTSFACVTIEFVAPHSQLRVSFIMSSCWSGMYGWKNASWNETWSARAHDLARVGSDLAEDVERQAGVRHQAPAVGRPEFAGARQRRRACRKRRRAAVLQRLQQPCATSISAPFPSHGARRGGIPGMSEMSEYWYVHSRSTGCPANMICTPSAPARGWAGED